MFQLKRDQSFLMKWLRIQCKQFFYDGYNVLSQTFDGNISQVLSTRKRKDVAEADVKVQVCLFGFDLLYLNGKSLVTLPFQVSWRGQDNCSFWMVASVRGYGANGFSIINFLIHNQTSGSQASRITVPNLIY